MKLKFKKVHPEATTPTRGSKEASGLDLYSLEDVILIPGETKLIRTGIAFDIPEGYEIQVRARSGMSLKTAFRVANGIGTIDKDFQGECCVIGWNSTSLDVSDPRLGITSSIVIKKGDRIAQAVLCPIVLPELEEVEDFNNKTERNIQGFGSTNK